MQNNYIRFMMQKMKNCQEFYVHHLLEVRNTKFASKIFNFLEPSLTINSHETQTVNGVIVHKLECRTSTNEALNLAMSDEKYHIFKSGTSIQH